MMAVLENQQTKSRAIRSIVRVGPKGKRNGAAAVAGDAELNAVDSRVELNQAPIPLGLEEDQELLAQEVTALVGARHQRGGGMPGYARWGQQPGSVYLADQNVRCACHACAISAATRRLYRVPGDPAKAGVGPSAGNSSVLGRPLQETYGKSIAELNRARQQTRRARLR